MLRFGRNSGLACQPQCKDRAASSRVDMHLTRAATGSIRVTARRAHSVVYFGRR